MGISVFLISQFMGPEWPQSPLRTAHDVMEQRGLESAPEKSQEVLKYEAVRSIGTHYATMDELCEILESGTDETGEVDAEDGVEVVYRYDGEAIRMTVRPGPDTGTNPMPVGLGGPNDWWFDPEQEGADTVERRLDVLSDLFIGLSSALDPAVAYLKLRNDHAGMEAIPSSHRPPEHDMESLPFLLLLSEPWIEFCGGRDHVLSTPAYEIQELDTGSIALRIKEGMSTHGCYYDTGYDHLFGGLPDTHR